MKRWLAALGLMLVATPAPAASTPEQDALVASYFSIWDDDSHVTPESVARLYAPTVVYYGHPMSRDALLRDKREFIRRWPERHYGVVPGSAANSCDAAHDRCILSATLSWRTSGASGTRAGRSRVSLVLVRSDGALKIVREGGTTLR